MKKIITLTLFILCLICSVAFAADKIDDLTDYQWLKKGKEYADKQDYASAIKAYSNAITINPRLPYVYVYRSFSYLMEGLYDDCIEDCSIVILVSPEFHENAYIYRGYAYVEKGLYSNAIDDFSKVISLQPLQPLQPYAYINRARVYAIMKLYDKAMDDYCKAIAVSPQFDIAYNNRGLLHALKGSYAQAIDDFNQAIAINPQYALPYYYKALAYEYLNNKNGAVEFYQKFLKIAKTGDPNIVTAQKRLAVLGD